MAPLELSIVLLVRLNNVMKLILALAENYDLQTAQKYNLHTEIFNIEDTNNRILFHNWYSDVTPASSE